MEKKLRKKTKKLEVKKDGMKKKCWKWKKKVRSKKDGIKKIVESEKKS